jgi:hypothetical protein
MGKIRRVLVVRTTVSHLMQRRYVPGIMHPYVFKYLSVPREPKVSRKIAQERKNLRYIGHQ